VHFVAVLATHTAGVDSTFAALDSLDPFALSAVLVDLIACGQAKRADAGKVG
jgi:hypothetical protein